MYDTTKAHRNKTIPKQTFAPTATTSIMAHGSLLDQSAHFLEYHMHT